MLGTIITSHQAFFFFGLSPRPGTYQGHSHELNYNKQVSHDEQPVGSAQPPESVKLSMQDANTLYLAA